MNDELALFNGKPEGDAIWFVTDTVFFTVEFYQSRNGPQAQAVATEDAFRTAGPG